MELGDLPIANVTISFSLVSVLLGAPLQKKNNSLRSKGYAVSVYQILRFMSLCEGELKSAGGQHVSFVYFLGQGRHTLLIFIGTACYVSNNMFRYITCYYTFQRLTA